MINLADIHPMTGFLREHKKHLERLRATGKPEVLTVNGKASVVIQDAAAYQKLVEAIESIRVEQTIRERLASLDSGEEGVPASEVLDEVRAKLGLKH